MAPTRTPVTLAQILGVLASVKARAERAITDAHQASQRPGPLSGITRTYTPRDELGERWPDERTLVQVRAADLVDTVAAALRELIDTVATVDATNASARADVVLADGFVMARDVPAVTLLALEKKLVDVATFVAKLPVLDPADEWTWDEASGTWRTTPSASFKMKKLPFNHVVAPATDKHPAQVQVYTEDAPIGTWHTVKFSGALQAGQARAMKERVADLQRAVRFARERANMAPAADLRIGDEIVRYLFAPAQRR